MDGKIGRMCEPWRPLIPRRTHVLLLFLVLLSSIVANVHGASSPRLSITTSDHFPSRLSYFALSDVVLYIDPANGVLHRSDDGGETWTAANDKDNKDKPISGIEEGTIAMQIVLHPWVAERAFLLTTSNIQYVTEDRGRTWRAFDSILPVAALSEVPPLQFHAKDPERIIFHGILCGGIFCDEMPLYTTDGFRSEAIILRTDGAISCKWALSDEGFSANPANRGPGPKPKDKQKNKNKDKEYEFIDKNRIFCITRDFLSPLRADQHMVYSDSFFAVDKESMRIDEHEIEAIGEFGPLRGAISMATVHKFLLVATASENSDELQLYVSDDAQTWRRAHFPTVHDHRLVQGSFTVLPGTEYSVQIDVMSSHPSNPLGVLFTSNSNGTFFVENLEYTNRDPWGRVDFEAVTGVRGVILVNTVANGDDVLQHPTTAKAIVSHISFDDGRTFEDIAVHEDGNDKGERLHLHSFTERNNMGAVFSSSAPGLLLGNGNIGTKLERFSDANLFVSHDAGLTWKQALRGPHKHAFGDEGSVLVVVAEPVDDGESVDRICYSLDYGDTWQDVILPDGMRIRPVLLTTTPDASTLKFLLIGHTDQQKKFQLISIDFDAIGLPECSRKDMEEWSPRPPPSNGDKNKDVDTRSTCVMGQKQTFYRRKKDAQCFLKKKFEEITVKTEDCECTDADFECDYNFILEGNSGHHDITDGKGHSGKRSSSPFDSTKTFEKRKEDDSSRGPICAPAGPVPDPGGQCDGKKGEDTFKGSSGWRLIPGNTCKRKHGPQKDDLVSRLCQDVFAGPNNTHGDNGNDTIGEVAQHRFVFDTERMEFEKVYLERADSVSEQDRVTVIARPITVDHETGRFLPEDKLWMTTDQGSSWKRILEKYSIGSIHRPPSFKEAAFFMTLDEKETKKGERTVLYTLDSGRHFHKFQVPAPAASSRSLIFHPDQRDWLLYLGRVCESVASDDGECETHAFLSLDRGDHWRTIGRDVLKCEFTGHAAYSRLRNAKQIICLEYEQDDQRNGKTPRLVVSHDFFESERIYPDIQAAIDLDAPQTLDNDDGKQTGKKIARIRDMVTMSEFIIIAAADDSNTPQDDTKGSSSPNGLVALASLDGIKFARAHFPYNFQPSAEAEYTVLDSSNHAINLFVATQTAGQQENGNIVKSNSNGTSYVVTLPGVNSNERFNVDYERIPGVEGVAVANIVANRQDFESSEKHNVRSRTRLTTRAEGKKIQTVITHNDGAEWAYLAPPAKDVDGNKLPCGSSRGNSKCALHLHHYTERPDTSKMFSAERAVGMIFGVGNVGESLESMDEADTFMSTDAGVTWKMVQRGVWTWQFGDQGSLAVLVQLWDPTSATSPEKRKKTKEIQYSLDEGSTWNRLYFAEEPVAVLDITSVSSGRSRNMLLWVYDDQKKEGERASVVHLNFASLTAQACTPDDYYVWTPTHPLEKDNDAECLFGHVTRYRRKKPGAQCWNDPRASQHIVDSTACACTRRDFECDYNYELDAHGQCQLVPGRQPLSVDEWCAAHPDDSAYYRPSGYRRVPLTTCRGGAEYDKVHEAEPCPGREEDFEREHRSRIGTFGVLMAIFVPIGLASTVGWWVYRNWQRRFGTIRLGDMGSGAGVVDERDPVLVKYAVIGISAIVAVVAALPVLGEAIWRRGRHAYQRFSEDRFRGGSRGSSSGGFWSRLFDSGASRGFGSGSSSFRSRGAYEVVDDDIDDVGALLGEEDETSDEESE